MKLDNSSSVYFEQAPAKVHPARLVAIYDIGKQPANEALGYASQNKTIWVYELLGKKGLPSKDMPGLSKPLIGTIAYHIRPGKHDVTLYDWHCYMDFAKKYFKPEK